MPPEEVAPEVAQPYHPSGFSSPYVLICPPWQIKSGHLGCGNPGASRRGIADVYLEPSS
jgi:hypothetical protein